MIFQDNPEGSNKSSVCGECVTHLYNLVTDEKYNLGFLNRGTSRHMRMCTYTSIQATVKHALSYSSHPQISQYWESLAQTY